MADTPSSLGRRYLPFIAIAAVQVLLVAVAPSKGPQAVKAGEVASGSVNGNTLSNDAASGDTGVAGASGSSAAGGSSAGGFSGGSSGGGVTAAGGTGGVGGSATTGDRSHCDKNGRQIGPPKYTMPPCVPVWHGGDNGGATMTGVDATHINYVWYKAKGDAQVNAILATQGLAASDDDACLGYQAYDKGWPLHPAKDAASYRESFVHNPAFTEEWCYFLGDDLIGVGYVDRLPTAMSAIYFFYEPALRDRSLGTWNVLCILADAARRGIPHVYLGYFVDGCRSLSYKANFRPNQTLQPDGSWRDFLGLARE